MTLLKPGPLAGTYALGRAGGDRRLYRYSDNGVVTTRLLSIIRLAEFAVTTIDIRLGREAEGQQQEEKDSWHAHVPSLESAI
jgi:hypothetical protein